VVVKVVKITEPTVVLVVVPPTVEQGVQDYNLPVLVADSEMQVEDPLPLLRVVVVVPVRQFQPTILMVVPVEHHR
jgi:hypothetical protein